MGKNRSQRKGAFLVFGIIAFGYLANFGISSLPDHSPWQYTAGCAFIVALGAGWFWLAGQPVTLRLDRARGTCRLSTPRLFFHPGTVETFPLERVRGVSVSEVTLLSHDGPNSTGYEVRLETKDGRAVPISVERSRRGADAVARRIKDFLRGGARQYGAAAQTFKEAVTLSPEYVEAHYSLGAAYHRLGDRAGALKQLQVLAKLRPQFAEELSAAIK